jgi:hypothetical protein
MNKDYFKIEIVRITLDSGLTRFKTVIYRELRRFAWFEKICNKLFGANLFQIERQYYEICSSDGLRRIPKRYVGTYSFENIEEALN